MNNMRRTSVSRMGTHHVDESSVPIYDAVFDEVLAFHAVSDSLQLAPVRSGKKSWHIKFDSSAAYDDYFDRTFGFYCGYAAVVRNGDWFHIDPSGQPLYINRYHFVGNYQDHLCMVCDQNDQYFHIDSMGDAVYPQRYRYCGDFREGIAVVQSETGRSTHIKRSGSFLHPRWFLDLDVFHKGLARARDETGWFHINSSGLAVYPERFANVEPFYNGFARVECFNGSLLIIDEKGNVMRQLRKPLIPRSINNCS